MGPLFIIIVMIILGMFGLSKSVNKISIIFVNYVTFRSGEILHYIFRKCTSHFYPSPGAVKPIELSRPILLYNAGVAQLVERDSSRIEVVGSNPTSRSFLPL